MKKKIVIIFTRAVAKMDNLHSSSFFHSLSLQHSESFSGWYIIRDVKKIAMWSIGERLSSTKQPWRSLRRSKRSHRESSIRKASPYNEIMENADFEKDICFTPYTLSVLFNELTLTFDFGYEVPIIRIYFIPRPKWPTTIIMLIIFRSILYRFMFRRNKKKIKASFWAHKKNMYITVKTAFELMHKKSRIPKRFLTKKLAHFIYGERRTAMTYDSYSKLVNIEHDIDIFIRINDMIVQLRLRIWIRFQLFMWVHVFEVEFDFTHWSPKRIFYEVRNNNRWPVTFSCKKYILDVEGYDKIKIDGKYSQVGPSTFE